jgi:hypothetical protein
MQQPNKRNKVDHWKNFQDKLNLFQTTDLQYWTEYQFLGYWIHLTGMVIEPANCPPSRHPQLQQMRVLAWKLCHPQLHKVSTAAMPKDLDVELIKKFLDWGWAEMSKRDLPCHSLAFLTGDRAPWVYLFGKHLRAENATSAPAKLDIGDPEDWVL